MNALSAASVVDTFRERVVLLDESGNASGTADKEALHTAETPLHLAFSCHLSNSNGEVLLTRRALNKRSWPGVWTNSFCGHPAPGESMVDAVVRHARRELGLTLDPAEHRLALELPDFRYRATDPGGIVENELCPVFTAVSDEHLVPNPSEVMEVAWVAPNALAAALANAPWAFSPWLVLQARELGAEARP